jgi:hypothetical protein
MVILRPTRKLSRQLPWTTRIPESSDTALGDWYVNRIVVNRQPLLILVCSRALLPLVIFARDVRELPSRLAGLVATRLRRLGVSAAAIQAETLAMIPVGVSPTRDRSVLGIMVDFAKAVPYHLENVRIEDGTLQIVEDRLAETPCHAGQSHDRVVFPETKAPELLRAKWGAG